MFGHEEEVGCNGAEDNDLIIGCLLITIENDLLLRLLFSVLPLSLLELAIELEIGPNGFLFSTLAPFFEHSLGFEADPSCAIFAAAAQDSSEQPDLVKKDLM